jgi:hypothetical protein
VRLRFLGLISALLLFSSGQVHAGVTCADPNHSPQYNVSSSGSNNVPVNQCYLNSVGECLYNTAIPGSAASWNTGCPSSIAGSDCCRWRKGEPTPSPRPTETPRPSPFPSGACCKAKPNANPGYDCSLPLLNFGHPQGISFAYQRCVQANGGASCQWSTQNRECCAAGVPGCASSTPSPAIECRPPNVWVSYPFQSLLPGNPGEYERCKKEAGASGSPEKYRCCVKPVAPTPTPKPSCPPPQIGVPFPFSALATNPVFSAEYAKCKQAAGSNTSYMCCVNPEDPCKRAGGNLFNGRSCPSRMIQIFGPVQGQVCCKPLRR